MEFRLLGPIEVVGDGRRLELGSRKQKAVLALLLLEAGEVVPRDRLIEELWHGKPPPTAEATLRTYLSRLRSVLGATRVQTRPPGHMLVAAPEELDAKAFERLLAAGRVALAEQRPSEAAELLADALALWRGDPLADFVYEPFAQNEVARLIELRLEALEERVEAELALGRDEALVAELGELVSEHPLRERLCRQLMLALYRSGRQVDALAVYADVRRTLKDELGLEPGPQLRALQRAILRQDESLAPPVEVLESTVREVRKTVSVLAAIFGDAASDPEARRALAERALERSAPVLGRHGGVVEQRRGSQVVVVFGVPSLHEDDALRAVRAAAELRERLAGLAEVRIGIATGEALAAGTSLTGAPVESAATLAAAAEPNVIQLDQETRHLAGVAVSVKRAGNGFRLNEVRSATRPLPVRLDTPFVGRQTELDELRAAFAEALASCSCRVVNVLGEAGIGKSRLAQQLARELGKEATVVTGSCPSSGTASTFWPLLEIVQQLAGGVDQARLRRLLAGEPGAESVAAVLASAFHADSTQPSIEEVFHAARRILEVAGCRRPLLVVLEDLHWADPTLLDLITHIGYAQAPLLLLCLARPELPERQRGCSEGSRRLELTALARGDAAVLLRALGEHEPLAEEPVLAAAQGNPLFLEQLAIARAANAGSNTELPLPATLQALLATRLERLGPAERALLDRGAIIGEAFTLAAATELLPEDARASAARHRDGLIRSGFLHSSSSRTGHGEDCEFRHGLIQETCYRAVPKRLRAELHERFARWLEHSQSALVELDEILGHHLEQAVRYRLELGVPVEVDLRDSTRGHLTSAGRRAIGRQDFAAARKLLERAAGLLSPSDVDVPLEIDFAYALFFSGSAEQAHRSLNAVAGRAGTARNRIGELCCLIVEAIFRFYVEPQGVIKQLREVAEEALPLFEAAKDDFALSLAHFARGQVAHHQNRWDTELAAVARAQFHARRTGMPHLEGWANPALAVARFYGSTPLSELLVWLDEREASGVRHLDFKGWRAVALAYLGRLDEARTLDAEMRREHAERGATLALGAWASQEATVLELLAGEAAIAATRAEEGCRLLEEAGERALLSTGLCYLAQALYALGQLDEAESCARRGVELAASDDAATQILSCRVQAKVLARRGRHGEAEELAQEAIAIGDATEAPIHQGDAYADLAEVLELAGRSDEAAAALREALNRYERKEALVPAQRVRKRLVALQPA